MDDIFQAFIFKYNCGAWDTTGNPIRYAMQMVEPKDEFAVKSVTTADLEIFVRLATDPTLLFPYHPRFSITTRLQNKVLPARQCTYPHDEFTAKPLSEDEWDQILSHLPALYLWNHYTTNQIPS